MHNSKTIPEGFHTIQLPFLPPSTLSYEDSTTVALTQPPSATASHLTPLTKTEIILPLQLLQEMMQPMLTHNPPDHSSSNSSTPPSTQQNARAQMGHSQGH